MIELILKGIIKVLKMLGYSINYLQHQGSKAGLININHPEIWTNTEFKSPAPVSADSERKQLKGWVWQNQLSAGRACLVFTGDGDAGAGAAGSVLVEY